MFRIHQSRTYELVLNSASAFCLGQLIVLCSGCFGASVVRMCKFQRPSREEYTFIYSKASLVTSLEAAITNTTMANNSTKDSMAAAYQTSTDVQFPRTSAHQSPSNDPSEKKVGENSAPVPGNTNDPTATDGGEVTTRSADRPFPKNISAEA